MNPEPSDLRFCSFGMRPKKLLKNSSNGSCWPNGLRIRGRLSFTTWVVEMLTTAGETSLKSCGMSTGSIRSPAAAGTTVGFSLSPHRARAIGETLNPAVSTIPAATAARTRTTTLLLRITVDLLPFRAPREAR